MILPQPRSTRTDTRSPYTTLFRSGAPATTASSATACACSTFRAPTTTVAPARPHAIAVARPIPVEPPTTATILFFRSEEHTSELQSLMRTSYAVLCLNKTNTLTNDNYEFRLYIATKNTN